MAVRKLTADIVALNDVLTALATLSTPEEKRWVLETAANREDVSLAGGRGGGSGAAGSGSALGTGGATRLAGGNAAGTPREFMRAKNPNNDQQRVACLGFYLMHHRETPQFKAKELGELNTEAAGPRFNMSRAVNNATHQSRYFAPAGGGRKQLTTLGEDVVNALPNQEAAKTAEQEAGRRRRKGRTGAKKKTATK